MTESATAKPTTFRRVVTGHENDRPTVLSDGPAPTEHHFTSVPGMSAAFIWANDLNPAVDLTETAPAGTNFVPQPGRTHLLMAEFPPDAVMAESGFDPAAAVAEQLQAMPGLAERMEPDNPGMHVTPTVDYAVVISGNVVLDLGDREEVELGPGDVVIQQMTRHAWRVRGTEPARLAIVLVGTDAAR